MNSNKCQSKLEKLAYFIYLQYPNKSPSDCWDHAISNIKCDLCKHKFKCLCKKTSNCYINNRDLNLSFTNCNCELVYHYHCINNYLLNIDNKCPICKKIVDVYINNDQYV